MRRSSTGRVRREADRTAQAPRSLAERGLVGRPARGTTLIEVLICCVLMLIITGGVYYVMVAGSRYFRVTNATIDVQEASMAALARLTQELGESDPRGFAAQSGCIVFASPRDANGRMRFDSSARMQWQKFISYYQTVYNGTPCLLRKERLLGGPQPSVPSPPLATLLKDDDTIPPSVMARNITGFEPSTASPVDLAVTAHLVDSGKDFQVTITSKVFLKN